MKIGKDMVVEVDYTLTNPEGEVLDSSDGTDPLCYLHGHDKIISGLEEALEGRSEGEELKVKIPPEKGYGERYDTMVQPVSRDQFEGAFDLEPGAQFEGETEVGPHLFTVVEVNGDEVVVDGNHPLAGLELRFELKILEVREASKDELRNGYPFGHEDDGSL